MELKAIEANVDQSKEIYASATCQQLINTMYEYYSKIGFNKPWIGYFAFNNNQVVGTGGEKQKMDSPGIDDDDSTGNKVSRKNNKPGHRMH